MPLICCTLLFFSGFAQHEVYHSHEDGTCDHISHRCARGLEAVMGSKERTPIRRLVDPNKRSVTCTNVSTFDPDYDSDMPTAAQDAFDYALDLMSDIYVADITITLDVVWEDVPGNVIGFAGSGAWRANLPFHPEPNKWYPEALTNEFNGSQFLASADVDVTLDSSANWYFGTDGNPAWNEIDLVSVIIHEVSHGLGFTGTANSSGLPVGTTIGWLTWPNIYDPFVEDGNGVSVTTLPLNSQVLLNALTGDDLYFNGFYTNGSNGGTPPKLKSDAPYVQGSSYSHLGDEFADETMRSYIVTGDAIHTMDTLGVAMMRDMGWEVCNDNCPDEMTVSNGNELDGNQTYQAAFESDGAIESIQTVDGGIDVFYDSQTSIELLSGFEVDANTNFEAFINGCGDN